MSKQVTVRTNADGVLKELKSIRKQFQKITSVLENEYSRMETNARQNERRIANRKAGNCYCGRKPMSGRKLCAPCIESSQRSVQKRKSKSS